MGFFNRKGSKSKTRSEGHLKNDHLSPPSNGPARSLKRANSDQIDNWNQATMSLPKAPDPNVDPAGYLKSIYAVRERSQLVLEKAKANQLRHFDVDMSKLGDTAKFVVSIIKVRNLRSDKNCTALGLSRLILRSEILSQTTEVYLRMVDGSTSRQVGNRELISFWQLGRAQSMLKNVRGDFSISFWSPCC